MLSVGRSAGRDMAGRGAPREAVLEQGLDENVLVVEQKHCGCPGAVTGCSKVRRGALAG